MLSPASTITPWPVLVSEAKPEMRPVNAAVDDPTSIVPPESPIEIDRAVRNPLGVRSVPPKKDSPPATLPRLVSLDTLSTPPSMLVPPE